MRGIGSGTEPSQGPPPRAAAGALPLLEGHLSACPVPSNETHQSPENQLREEESLRPKGSAGREEVQEGRKEEGKKSEVQKLTALQAGLGMGAGGEAR